MSLLEKAQRRREYVEAAMKLGSSRDDAERQWALICSLARRIARGTLGLEEALTKVAKSRQAPPRISVLS